MYLTYVDLAYLFDFERLDINLNYNGGLSAYQDYNEHRFNISAFNADIQIPIMQHLLYGAEIGFMRNGHDTEYAVFDNRNLELTTNLRLNLGNRFFQAASFTYLDKDYHNTMELSFREYQLSLSSRLFLETRTTLIMELHLKQKDFTHDSTVLEKVIYEKDMGNPGYGKGRGNPYGGYGNGYSSRPDSLLMISNISRPGVSQAMLNLKIAQSITASTGMSIGFSRYFPASETTRYLTGQDYFYNEGDELYDDPYTYHSKGVQLTLTQMLPFDAKFEGYVSYADKKYNYNIDSLSTGGNDREDNQWRFGMGIRKQITPQMIDTVNLTIDLLWLKNTSNEVYFDYKGFSVMTGIGVSF
ncbi:hypothetical protein JXB12_09115 [candidate division KSB1 bacterium]|nr:hypothetical protein [candidate division KSB1 bacterium]